MELLKAVVAIPQKRLAERRKAFLQPPVFVKCTQKASQVFAHFDGDSF